MPRRERFNVAPSVFVSFLERVKSVYNEFHAWVFIRTFIVICLVNMTHELAAVYARVQTASKLAVFALRGENRARWWSGVFLLSLAYFSLGVL